MEQLTKRSLGGGKEETKDEFANDDIAIEVLSWLPIKSTNEFKCVCKRWYELLSHPSFKSSHFHRSAKTISGLFVQGLLYCDCCGNYIDIKVVTYISIGEDERHAVYQKVFDILPEKVVVMASCNGLLLCRNIYKVDHSSETMKAKPQEVVLYVCNPLTKEWTALKPHYRYENGSCYGFVHNPSGSSGCPEFEVVLAERPLHVGKDPYRFKIYSSRIGAWRTSKEVCTLRHRLHAHHSCFTNGVFYWLTFDHSILTFDLKQERSEVIKLPGHPLHTEITEGSYMCLGVSEGNLHYVCINMVELMIWVLKYDTLSPKWDLKYVKPQLEMCHPLMKGWEWLPTSRSDPLNWRNWILRPYALQDGILYMEINGIMCSYNFKTEEINELWNLLELNAGCITATTVIPYVKSLLQVPR
ncbi:hypothetical protein AQUCO_03000346v1 [Aquilegia coerulea]|uniref:F-box domain-containing protein n=1 Tax=Aquilegia coerulea TaxID=218851 RepID=A0A2G5D2L3_AQUCA|nr:hypothetical protein AQUCO_03000346v1 [Aquilegia coerulea]